MVVELQEGERIIIYPYDIKSTVVEIENKDNKLLVHTIQDLEEFERHSYRMKEKPI